MEPNIYPLAATNVQLNVLDDLALKIIERAPVKFVDTTTNVKLGAIQTFLAALANIKNPKLTALDAARNCLDVLHHVQLSFIYHCDADTLILILNYGAFKITSEGDFGVITADLRVWHDAIISGTNSPKKSVRLFFDKVLLWFDKSDMRQLFERYTRNGKEDGTFSLRQP